MPKITLSRGKNLLALVWLIGFIPPFLILAARTFVGTYYAGKETEAWSWFSPNIVPTLGLIISSIAAAGSSKKAGDKQVSSGVFALAFGLSLFYLLLFNLIFFLEPLVDSAPLEIFKRSSLFLGIVQGFVTTALGVFFIRTAKNA